MANPNAYRTASGKFDPVGIFPSRVADKVMTAERQQPGSGISGATDLKNNHVSIPTANNAYARTVRLHEALHAIYTKPSSDPSDYNMLGQALEDARLHLNCAKTSGTVRRDELATALRDLRKGSDDKALAALLALRSAAILQSHPDDASERKLWPHAIKLLKSLCDRVDAGFSDQMLSALGHVQAERMAEARTLLQPYFESDESKETPRSGAGLFPNGKGETESEKSSIPTLMSVKFDAVEGKLTSEAADMLDRSTLEKIAAKECPTLNILHLFATANIPTYFGEDQKHTLSGSKIDAKKLATVVGPTAPHVFLKTIRRNGGTVIIDASGSMSINAETLRSLCTVAPMATVGFYNAPNDYVLVGNLWLFAHKGKRALDLTEVRFDAVTKHIKTKHGVHGEFHVPVSGHETCYGSGNVVDLQVIQWMLTQPAPRYILTDAAFTGPTAPEASVLLDNAIARKKIIQVREVQQLRGILAKGGAQ